MALLEVRSVEFDFEKNNAAHHTRGVSSSSPILRRGQPFTITLHLNRTFQERNDTLDLIAETGPSPSEASGTRAVFRVSGPPVKSSWSAAVQNSSFSSVTLSVTSPANASIGKYSLKIQAAKGTPQTSALGEFILLFNPWCAADSVFLANEDERQEYVMSEHGFVYQGTSEHIEATPWDFGQFEADIVHICLELLDVSPKHRKNPGLDCSRRSDPTYVGRVVSAMVRSVKERAVFEKAIQRGSRILKNMLEHSDSYQITKGVQLNFVQETHAVSGKEIAVTLVIFNNSETAKSLTLNLNAQVMLYTGRPACQIWSRRVTTKIGPNTETEFPVSIAYSQYGRILRHNNTVKLTAIVVEDGGSREMSFTEKNIVVSGDPVQYQPMMAEVTFFNPLLEPLTDCSMSLTGSGLLFKTIDTCVGTLGPQLRVRLQIPFTPTKTGSRMLTVGFNSDQFCDIKAYTSVTINPPK
ncbi:UNVERIFIED_CONTAM: hypothetical protein FKN15_026066 [Acipenser sinensis]